MCEFSFTESRRKVVDFSEYILLNEITFLSQSPGLRDRTWIVSQPFSRYLWYTIIGSLFLLSTIVYGIRRTIIKCQTQSYTTIMMYIYAISLQKSTNLIKKDKRSSLRIIYGVWMFTTLILSNSYGSSFYSILTIPEYDLPIDTAMDIYDISLNHRKTLIVRERSASWWQFVHSNPSNQIYYQIGKHLNQSKIRMKTFLKEFMPKLNVPNSPYVVIANRIVLEIHRIQFATRNLHIGNDNIGLDFMGYIMHRRSPLVLPFDMM
ncbi:hypothetical protein RDWZM_000515 [Blomia tropicalis]|uniref:Ionotropic glutamate receptor C-terminal domain-containing protein n=1 Tax=Blomia tropicalis TaxID=40697 RepID=A0A9Q0M9Y7_BLOTA|nr:hypothetical protein RDWZM_000515 [Blomia tropicalis]